MTVWIGIKQINIGGGWLPDLPDELCLSATGLKEANNVIPYNGYYYPINGLYRFCPDALEGDFLAWICHEDSSLIRRNFAFTTSKCYRFDSSGAEEIDCFVNTPKDISAISYGDWIIATNGIESVKVLKDISSDTFEDLGGTPPYAKYLTFCKGHLILANLIEDSTSYPKRVRWSARENIEDWEESLTTGADFQDFPDTLGEITGIANMGDMFAIFFEDSIVVGAYSGGYYTFNFQTAYRNIGCPNPKSIVSVGDSIYFWGRDGIYHLSPSGLKDISYGRIKKAVIENFNKDAHLKISTIYDYQRKLILWAYPTSSAETPDKILVYSIPEDKFTLLGIATNGLLLVNYSSSDLDDLTDVAIDSFSAMIDSQQFRSSLIVPMAIDSSGYVCSFGGDIEVASLLTPTFSSYPKVIHYNGLAIKATGGYSGYVIPYYKFSENESDVVAGAYDFKSDQRADFRVSGRFVKFRIQLEEFTSLKPDIYINAIERGEK